MSLYKMADNGVQPLRRRAGDPMPAYEGNAGNTAPPPAASTGTRTVVPQGGTFDKPKITWDDPYEGDKDVDTRVRQSEDFDRRVASRPGFNGRYPSYYIKKHMRVPLQRYNDQFGYNNPRHFDLNRRNEKGGYGAYASTGLLNSYSYDPRDTQAEKPSPALPPDVQRSINDANADMGRLVNSQGIRMGVPARPAPGTALEGSLAAVPAKPQARSGGEVTLDEYNRRIGQRTDGRDEYWYKRVYGIDPAYDPRQVASPAAREVVPVTADKPKPQEQASRQEELKVTDMSGRQKIALAQRMWEKMLSDPHTPPARRRALQHNLNALKIYQRYVNSGASRTGMTYEQYLDNTPLFSKTWKHDGRFIIPGSEGYEGDSWAYGLLPKHWFKSTSANTSSALEDFLPGGDIYKQQLRDLDVLRKGVPGSEEYEAAKQRFGYREGGHDSNIWQKILGSLDAYFLGDTSEMQHREAMTPEEERLHNSYY